MDMFGENYRGIHALKLLEQSQRLDLGRAAGRGLRQLSAGLRRADPAAWSRHGIALPGGDPRKHALAEPIAHARAVGLSLERAIGSAEPGRLLGRRAVGPACMRRRRAATRYDAAARRDTSRRARSSPPWNRQSPGFSAISAAGRPHGARSTASSAFRRRSTIRSAMTRRASPSPSPTAITGRSRRPVRHRGTGRNAGTAPAATASSRWSNSGPRVRAKAVSAGGESGDPSSPHFNDQAARYAAGDLRAGLFLSREPAGPHRADLSARASN